MHLLDVDSAPICSMCAALQVEVGVAREPTYKCALFGATSAECVHVLSKVFTGAPYISMAGVTVAEVPKGGFSFELCKRSD